jgi:hypothetical protein
MRLWTPEERERQAMLIRQWKPWQQSTGAKTAEGKRNSSQNALKHGLRSAEWLTESKLVNDLLREGRKRLAAVDLNKPKRQD